MPSIGEAIEFRHGTGAALFVTHFGDSLDPRLERLREEGRDNLERIDTSGALF